MEYDHFPTFGVKLKQKDDAAIIVHLAIFIQKPPHPRVDNSVRFRRQHGKNHRRDDDPNLMKSIQYRDALVFFIAGESGNRQYAGMPV
jgi:hypothetical protein